jgi:ABC-type phosphate transport system permease subunit
MSGSGRWPLGVIAFLPIVAVLAFAVFLVVESGSAASDDGLTFILLIVVHWRVFATLVVLRVIVGTVLALHAWRNLKSQPSSRTTWAIRLFFFTEMRAPQYWLEHVR